MVLVSLTAALALLGVARIRQPRHWLRLVDEGRLRHRAYREIDRGHVDVEDRAGDVPLRVK